MLAIMLGVAAVICFTVKLIVEAVNLTLSIIYKCGNSFINQFCLPEIKQN
jgi:hypothetical protein